MVHLFWEIWLHYLRGYSFFPNIHLYQEWRYLFLCLAVEETIDIIMEKIFSEPNTIFHNFNATDFRKLLELAVLDTAFIFNGYVFKQVDGMAMGSPLGPIFANIFMCKFEEQLLDSCPLRFYPLFYRRYVDDTFALFRTRDDANAFLDFANNRHHNIRFSLMEMK